MGYLALNHLSPFAGSAGWPDWELPFLHWAEREGYAIDVVTNADLEEHPELLARPGDGGYALFLSVGHDEYWSGPMRDTVEGFIGRGGNAAFLSGNTVVLAGAARGAHAGGTGRDDGRLQGQLEVRTRSTTPTASAS